VSQPDKHPEGSPRDENARDYGRGPLGRQARTGKDRQQGERENGSAGGSAGPTRGWWRVHGALRRPSWRPPRRAPRGDLRGTPFPLGDWNHPAARLDELYRWAEDSAIRTIEWYLNDRLWKRRSARALRIGAVLSTAVGMGLPLLALAAAQPGLARWGYVWLLVAAACVGADRWFGLTSGWMRDVATAQAVHRRLEALRFDWASESVREVLGPAEGTATEAVERCLAVLRRFCEDVSELVRDETMDWMVEFRAGPAPLHTQALAGWGRRCDGNRQQYRFPPLPGSRPTMPRQRPPEGPGR
jgi:hypothetical protein